MNQSQCASFVIFTMIIIPHLFALVKYVLIILSKGNMKQD